MLVRGGAGRLFAACLSGFLCLPAVAQAPVLECPGLTTRLEALIERYQALGRQAIEHADPPAALAAARAAAMKGDHAATLTGVGVTLLMRGQSDLFPVSVIRQVCTFGQRNGLPLHIVTCAYFNALNPLGARSEKRKAVEAEIARLEPAGPLEPALAEAMGALKACLAPP
jgi:hypothetical protein